MTLFSSTLIKTIKFTQNVNKIRRGVFKLIEADEVFLLRERAKTLSGDEDEEGEEVEFENSEEIMELEQEYRYIQEYKKKEESSAEKVIQNYVVFLLYYYTIKKLLIFIFHF